jgi:hypothetical protein
MIHTPEEQIANVKRALAALEGCRPFRGQEDLAKDLSRYLELLQEARSRGELSPVAYEEPPAWGQWVGLAALVAGALRVVSVLL